MAKAQVTLFIIIGIILLLIIGLYYVIRNDLVSIPGVTQQRLTERVPQEFQPISSFVEFCITQTAVQGLRVAGSQGGYLYLQDNDIQAAAQPTEGNAISLLDTTTVPYYYYLSSSNGCTKDCDFDTKMPYLTKKEGTPNIEAELERYINDNLDSCLGNYLSFRDQGYAVEEEQQPSTTVTVAERTVNVIVDYPIKVTSFAGDTREIKRFGVNIPLDLRSIYAIASELVSKEQEYTYVEKHMLNLIVGYGGLDRAIPPMYDLDFDIAGGKRWQKSGIKEAVTNIFGSNIQLLQMGNTANYQYRSADSAHQDAYLNRGTLIPADNDYSNYNVYFNYYAPELGWDIYFDMNCGSTCKPNSAMNNLLGLFGIQEYKFRYDVSTPVLVEIHAPNELTNYIQDGYRFQFAMEANVRENTPMKAAYEHIAGAPVEATLFCDEDKRFSGVVDIDVKDSVSSEGLQDAVVQYTCGRDTCTIGTTGSDGKLSTKFPVCLGGVVVFQKENFQQEAQSFSIDLDEEAHIEAVLDPMKEMAVAVKKKNVIKQGDAWTFVETPYNLEQNEEAAILLTRVAEPTEYAYSTGTSYTLGEETSVRLLPGTYDLSINVLMSGGEQYVLNIPEETRTIEGRSVTIDAVQAHTAPSGGLKKRIIITNEDLLKSKITFYTVGIDPRQLSKVEDVAQLSKFEEYSDEQGLAPVFE